MIYTPCAAPTRVSIDSDLIPSFHPLYKFSRNVDLYETNFYCSLPKDHSSLTPFHEAWISLTVAQQDYISALHKGYSVLTSNPLNPHSFICSFLHEKNLFSLSYLTSAFAPFATSLLDAYSVQLTL